MRKQILWPLLLVGILLLSGCGLNEGTSETDAAGTPEIFAGADASEMFTDRDMEIGYDEETSTKIALSGSGASCDSNAVSISGSTVTISDEGTYILSGTLSDGMVVVEADDMDKVQLVLDGVDIANPDSAAIYVRSADKVFITTAADSENRLSNGGTYTAIDENNIDAVVFSKSDLTLNGAGTLSIEAAAGHGVVSKDDLVLTSGTYDITAASHGLSGKDSVRIANGTYTISSGKDGIQAENTDDTSLGFLFVAGGSFQITAQGDGMSASAYLQVEDGAYTILSGGGSANAPVHEEFPPLQRGNPEAASNAAPTNSADPTSTESADDSVSMKGLKATADLLIRGGTFNIDSEDDSLHSNGNLAVSGGSFEISSGDDALHADSAVVVSAGNFNITKSYEGIEGLSIDITGGDIALVSSDDGLNAAGGNDSSGFGGRGGDMFAVTEGAYIKISGGTLQIDASGDGIDSNGDLTVSGGETYVSGPTSGADSSLDCNGEAVISGGIFVAAGSAEMAQNFGTASTQGVLMTTVDAGSAGSTISLCDNNGSELLTWQAKKEYSSVIISCPEIQQGATYTLHAGSYSTQITMDSLVYGSGGMSGGGGRGGGMPGGNMPDGGRNGEAPDGNMPSAPPDRGMPREGQNGAPPDGAMSENRDISKEAPPESLQ